MIFVTGQGDVPATVRAMKRGAVDFLTKPAPSGVLLGAIREALERDRVRRAAREGRDEIGRRLAALTGREREVLEGVVAGPLNKQIARKIGIAEKTVKTQSRPDDGEDGRRLRGGARSPGRKGLKFRGET